MADPEVPGIISSIISSIEGNPTPDEEAAILEALELLLARGRRSQGAAPRMSAWVLAGRLAARRSGILDARTALGQRSWPATAGIPWRGRPFESRAGRGDSQ